MGLFWSMKQEPEQQRGLRIVKRDVTTPLVTTLAVYDGHREDLHEMLHSKALATSSIERWYMASHVTRAEVREGDLHGTLFIPEGRLAFAPPGLYNFIRFQTGFKQNKWH